jgi:hypothetical protein
MDGGLEAKINEGGESFFFFFSSIITLPEISTGVLHPLFVCVILSGIYVALFSLDAWVKCQLGEVSIRAIPRYVLLAPPDWISPFLRLAHVFKLSRRLIYLIQTERPLCTHI